ncbi:hypothetical protein DPMN_037157 [Dreissena polymorpha]|uniref:Uncharacterized protein n=1 Tax=Dreissena polymorpha TaxID=45954 RepID=A0A9D4RM31_DREPO|nr:hypothetical protein DPMN_037157 [Dreissena polymorpha]
MPLSCFKNLQTVLLSLQTILPVVIGLPITELSLVAKDFSATDTVFTATGSDVENDNVIYSMLSCTPNATCPFIMSPSRLFSKHFTRSESFTR